MDLNKIVNDAMTDIQKEGVVEQIVRKKLEKTLESVVDDVLSSYGDFGKQLKELVKENIGIDITRLDLPSYNTLVLHVIKEKLDELVHLQGMEKLKTQLDTMLADIKPEYKLSEILSEWMKEKNEDGDKDEEEITLHIDESKYGGRWVAFDEESGKSEYSCDFRMLIREDNTIAVLKIGDKELTSKTIMAGLYNMEAMLFKIYAHGSKLMIDEDDIETAYPLSYED